MAISYDRQVTDLLKQQGFKLIRKAKGFHEIWADQYHTEIVVPRNLFSRHTANGASVQARCLRSPAWRRPVAILRSPPTARAAAQGLP